MAFEAFLNFGDEPGGESAEKDHHGWIELLSWNLGVERHYSGSQLTSPRVDFSTFTVTKYVDSASAPLMRACTTAELFTEVIIETCRRLGGAESVPYIRYTLKDCRVQQVNWNAVPQGDIDRPTEEVSLVYSQIAMSYTFIDPGHGVGGDFEAAWDLSTAE